MSDTNYKTLKDHVYEFMLEEIKKGNLNPGEKLSEKMICDKMGVSRTPVREALIQLSNEGLLEKEPRKGFIVRKFTSREVREVYRIIGALESLAVETAVENLKEEDIKEMKKIVEEIDRVVEDENFDEYYKLREKFHLIYIQACDNNMLSKMINRLKRKFVKRKLNNNLNNSHIKTLKELNKQHKKIIELIEKNEISRLKEYIKDVHWSEDYAERLDTLE